MTRDKKEVHEPLLGLRPRNTLEYPVLLTSLIEWMMMMHPVIAKVPRGARRSIGTREGSVEGGNAYGLWRSASGAFCSGSLPGSPECPRAQGLSIHHAIHDPRLALDKDARRIVSKNNIGDAEDSISETYIYIYEYIYIYISSAGARCNPPLVEFPVGECCVGRAARALYCYSRS